MKLTRKHHTILFASTAAIVLVVGAGTYGAYKYGYRNGQRDEKAKRQPQQVQTLDQAFNNTTEFFRKGVNVTGTITKVTDSSLVVTQTDNQTRTITTDKKTVVTKNGKKTNLKSLEKDQKVSVTLDETSKDLATRITIK